MKNLNTILSTIINLIYYFRIRYHNPNISIKSRLNISYLTVDTTNVLNTCISLSQLDHYQIILNARTYLFVYV